MTVSTVPKTVLIIDDEPSIVDLLKDILESANYRAIGVVKWTDAVDAIGHEKPSLILLDLKMPTIDGPSLLEFLRKEGVQIPVIIVSGFITDEVSEDLKKLDVEAFVQKPFRAADIIAHVKRVIGSAQEPTEQPGSAEKPEPENVGPASMTAFLASPDSDGKPVETKPPASPDQADVLAALTKLDKGSNPAPPTPAEPNSASAGNDTSDVLNALKKHDTAAPAQPQSESPTPPSSAQPAADRSPSSVEPPAAPSRPVPLPPATAPPPTAPPEPTFSDTLVGTTRTDEQPGPHRERRDHHRRHTPPRRRRLTRRNVLLFGSLFVTCVVVAGFMTLMRYYASKVDIAEIQKQATESIRKEATKEILKELNK